MGQIHGAHGSPVPGHAGRGAPLASRGWTRLPLEAPAGSPPALHEREAVRRARAEIARAQPRARDPQLLAIAAVFLALVALGLLGRGLEAILLLVL